jgi:hypothetical protein
MRLATAAGSMIRLTNANATASGVQAIVGGWMF